MGTSLVEVVQQLRCLTLYPACNYVHAPMTARRMRIDQRPRHVAQDLVRVCYCDALTAARARYTATSLTTTAHSQTRNGVARARCPRDRRQTARTGSAAGLLGIITSLTWRESAWSLPQAAALPATDAYARARLRHEIMCKLLHAENGFADASVSRREALFRASHCKGRSQLHEIGWPARMCGPCRVHTSALFQCADSCRFWRRHWLSARDECRPHTTH